MLLEFNGCYSMQEVTKEEFSPAPDYPKLSIITDEREFTFNQADIHLRMIQFTEGKSTLLNEIIQNDTVVILLMN